MKKSLIASLIVAAFAATSLVGAPEAGKSVTLTGTLKCAKCSLGVTDECQNALVVKNGDKEETYLLTANDVSEKFHDNICKSDQPGKVTGTVKEVKGKKEITPTKIELSKG